MDTIVIIGAGQAGGWAAQTLRSEGFAGRIVLVGDESHPPHERPPLSKAVMAGEAEPASTHLFPADQLGKLALEARSSTRATAIDRNAKTVALGSGETIHYDKLMLSTGGTARRLTLPGGDGPRVYTLRTIEDSLAIRSRLATSKHVTIIGGGWIGLEIAATARKRSVAVTVVETMPRLCERSVPPEISDFLLQLHQRNDVEVLLSTNVTSIEDTGNGVAIALANGRSIASDAVVAGIGLLPNVALAQAAGLEINNGIVVDEQGRTTDPDIFAAGDCANLPLPCLGRRVRLESWANAQNQAIVAAKAMLGQDARYNEIPWFWSDQYDVNLQILGLPASWPTSVVRGDPERAPFCRFYLDTGKIVSVVSVNATRDLRAAKRLMLAGKSVDPAALVDPATNLAKL